MLEREEIVHLEERKQSSLVLWVLHCTWLKSVLRNFVGFFPPPGFPWINISVIYSVVLVVLSVILLFWHNKF